MFKSTSYKLTAGALGLAAAISASSAAASTSATVTGISSSTTIKDTSGLTPSSLTLSAFVNFYVTYDILGNISQSAGQTNVTTNNATNVYDSRLTVSCKDSLTGVVTANTQVQKNNTTSNGGDINHNNASLTICPFGRVA